MKKTRMSALALAGVMLLSLCACGAGESEPTPDPAPTGSVNVTPPPPEAPPSESVQVVTPSPEAESTQPGNDIPPEETDNPEYPPETQSPAGTPEPTPVSEPTPTPTPEPTPAPTPEPAAVTVARIWEDIAAGRDLPELMDLDDGLLDALYGIDAADLDEYVAKIPMMGTWATEFFLARVRPGKMEDVKAGVNARLSDLKGQWEQYLPDQRTLVDDAQVVESGDYILFCICADAQSAAGIFQDCTK